MFFRVQAKKTADRLGLTGYVKNLADGRVKIVAEGQTDRLNKFLEWAAVGPELARVENIEKSFSQFNGSFDGFEIRY